MKWRSRMDVGDVLELRLDDGKFAELKDEEVDVRLRVYKYMMQVGIERWIRENFLNF